MLLRDIPITLSAMTETSLITCSTASQVFGGTGVAYISSNGATGAYGRTIDRLADDLFARYQVAIPQVIVQSTRGSTEANRQITVGLQLHHGDSSGGGDLAEYSTQNRPAVRALFSTARTSDMANWSTAYSTGVITGLSSLPAIYDLRAAKRFIAVLVQVQKNRVTTESSGDEGLRIRADITFAGGDQVPQTPTSTVAWSSSTST